jgi:cyclopropane-fatty-acyl-phospholipid synthase
MPGSVAGKSALERLIAPTGILLTDSESDYVAEQGPAILVRNPGFYGRVLRSKNLGFAESYMDGWCELKRIDEIYYRAYDAALQQKLRLPLVEALDILLAQLLNRQTPARARRDTNAHYDLGNEMFALFLTDVPLYTCGYWHRDGMTLEEANRAAFDLTCRKLELKPGMKLIDVGCGWGALLEHAARHYGVTGLGVNISEPQLEACRARCKGLPVEFLLQDCRLLDRRRFGEQFDAIGAVAMINHIGPKNYHQFFETMHAVLRDRGLFLLQGIANRERMYRNDPFMDKYIFPGGVAPSMAQLLEPAERYFTLEDFHNFTSYYPRTLRTWNANFQRNWQRIQALGFDERFRRMWEIFLLSAAGTCQAREVIIFQAVFSKGRRDRVYAAPR